LWRRGKKAWGWLPRFDRRAWMLLAAMLVFRFGRGLCFPYSSIYFHNVLGGPLAGIRQDVLERA
jgi:hypothetical protein